MPGIRKPTNVLELKGAFKKDPQRARARSNEPTDERDVGKPPRGLSKDERAAWKELTECAIPGVLRYADRPAVLAASQLYARMKNQRGLNDQTRDHLLDQIEYADLEDPTTLRSVLLDIVRFTDRVSAWRPADMSNLTRLLAQMGMTPADRSKIVVPKKDAANPFDED